MDFRFDEDSELFAATVRDILTNECPPSAVRAAWENDSGTVPGLWETLAATGVIGMTAPEAAGGLGMGDLDLVLILEELGRAACPEIVLEHTALALPLLAQAPAAIQDRWLAPAAAGEARVTVALDSPYALGAAQSDLMLLTRDGAIHAVEPGAATLNPQPSVDETRRLCRVEDWSATPDTLVTNDADLAALTSRRAAVGAAAQCVGIAQRLLDFTVEYVQERQQFGKPVGVNQAVKHHLANTGKAIEFARPMVHVAAWTLSNGGGEVGGAEAVTAAPMAKLLASRAVDLAARSALQCHGAIAYTVEYDLQLWMKRGWALASAWGDESDQRHLIGQALGI